MPDAARIFGPETISEMSIAIDKPGESEPISTKRMIGRIDRIVLDDDLVWIIDIKSDATPPGAPAQVPRKYLAQLGAYQSAVSAIWPQRRVETAILWTRNASLMNIPTDQTAHAFATANWNARPS